MDVESGIYSIFIGVLVCVDGQTDREHLAADGVHVLLWDGADEGQIGVVYEELHFLIYFTRSVRGETIVDTSDRELACFATINA